MQNPSISHHLHFSIILSDYCSSFLTVLSASAFVPSVYSCRGIQNDHCKIKVRSCHSSAQVLPWIPIFCWVKTKSLLCPAGSGRFSATTPGLHTSLTSTTTCSLGFHVIFQTCQVCAPLGHCPSIVRHHICMVSHFFLLFQFSSVAQSCPTLCDPMERSTPGLSITNPQSLPKLMSIESVVCSKVNLLWALSITPSAHVDTSYSPILLYYLLESLSHRLYMFLFSLVACKLYEGRDFCLPFSLLNLQHLEQCLGHSRHSINA